MSNIAITPATITAFDTATDAAAATSTSTEINISETFEFALTGKPSKVAFIFSNANSHGTYTYSIAAGVLGVSGKAKTGSILQNKPNAVVQIETGRYINANGKIEITLTPASGKKLYTDHGATVRVINLI